VLAVTTLALLAAALVGPGVRWSGATILTGSGVLRGTNYLGDGVETPTYVAADGTSIWVANSNPQTVTELSEANGVVEAITPIPYALSGNPNGIATDATHVWVTSFYGGGLTELSKATGAVVSTISIPGLVCPCDETSPLAAISDDGTDVWITEFDPPYTGVIVEVDINTDSIVRSETFGSQGAPFQPAAVDSDGTDVWTAGSSGVDEFSAATGAMIQAISGPNDDLQGASGIATDGEHVWVMTPDAVIELSEATGAFIRSISTPVLVGGASSVATDGSDVWVVIPNGVVEISEASGDVIRTVSGSRYGITDAHGVVSNGTHVWVLDNSPGSFTELAAATGQALHPVSANWNLANPVQVTSGDNHVWVLGSNGSQNAGAVTELSAVTGRQTGYFGGRGNPLGWPYQLVNDGPDVWVLSGRSNSTVMTEFSSATGARLRGVIVGGDIGRQPEFALSEGRLWVTSDLTSLYEYSAATGRYLGSLSDSAIGLPTGISAITSYAGQVIASDQAHFAVLSGSTGRRLRLFPQKLNCSYPVCSIEIMASANSIWALVDVNGPGSLFARQYSLSTGAALRTLTAASTHLTSLSTTFLTGSSLWVEGKVGNIGADQGWELQQRSFATGSLEHKYTGGSFGFQSPGYASALGSQVWVPNSGGDSITEFQLAG